MKALVYHGPRKVSVDNVPDANIEKPTDVLVRITTTNICGSDLHMYEGRTDCRQMPFSAMRILARSSRLARLSTAVKVGDKVVLPFNIGCGFCANCERGFLRLLPHHRRSLRYAQHGRRRLRLRRHGPLSRRPGRSLLRVPYGDFNCLVLPDDQMRRRATTSCSPTSSPPDARHAARQPHARRFRRHLRRWPGRSDGHPVCAIQGASQIFVVDHNKDRLELPRSLAQPPIVRRRRRERRADPRGDRRPGHRLRLRVHRVSVSYLRTVGSSEPGR